MRFVCVLFGTYACGAPARTFRFTVVKIWPQYWARVTNITPNLRRPQKYWMDIKTAASLGLIMNECTANCWLRDTRPLDFPRPTLTAFACYAPRKVPHNATAAWPLNILHRNFPTPTFPGGWGGIRTPGGVAPTTVFKTVAIDRSATHPKLFYRRSLNLRFCSLGAPGGAAHHSFARGCALLALLTRMQDRRNQPLCHPS